MNLAVALEVFELELDLGPDDLELAETVETPLEHLLLLLFEVVVEGELDEKVEEDVSALVVAHGVEDGGLLGGVVAFEEAFAEVLELPLDVDEGEVADDLLVHGVVGGEEEDELPSLEAYMELIIWVLKALR